MGTSWGGDGAHRRCLGEFRIGNGLRLACPQDVMGLPHIDSSPLQSGTDLSLPGNWGLEGEVTYWHNFITIRSVSGVRQICYWPTKSIHCFILQIVTNHLLSRVTIQGFAHKCLRKGDKLWNIQTVRWWYIFGGGKKRPWRELENGRVVITIQCRLGRGLTKKMIFKQRPGVEGLSHAFI